MGNPKFARVDRLAFTRLLASAARIAKPHHTVKTLECIKLVAEPGELRIIATDLSITFDAVLPCDGQLTGAFAVPGRRLHAMVSAFAGAEVVLEAGEPEAVELFGRLRLRSGASDIDLVCGNAEAYPDTPDVPRDGLLAVDRVALAECLAPTTPRVFC